MAFQGDSIYWVEVEKIVPNPFQPRREFDEQKLSELADSVRMYGILQPLTVTRNEVAREDGTFYTEYELIAGERRLRASKLAGLSQVPVIIREGDDSEQEKLELAIIENLQREDLNAIDRALAFKQLAELFGLSHTQVAKKVGRSREYVSNSIRLLGLPDYMQTSLRQGKMSEGHARTLLMLSDRPVEQDVVFREILLKKLSVREVERIARKIATDRVRKKDSPDFDTELIAMEKKFMETLGTRVQIQKTDFGGKLTIDYFSVDELELMLTRMHAEPVAAPQDQSKQFAVLASNTPLTERVEVPAASPLPLPVAMLPVVLSVPDIESPDPLPYIETAQVEPKMNLADEALFSSIAALASLENIVDTEALPNNQMALRSVDGTSESYLDVITAFEEPLAAEEYSQEGEPIPVEEIIKNSTEDSVTIPEVAQDAEEVAELAALVADATKNTEEETGQKSNLDDESDLYSIRHFSV